MSSTPSVDAPRAAYSQTPPVDGDRPVAHVIRDDAEALAVAQALAEQLAKEAGERDRARRLPYAEVDAFSQSGLWAITVPKAYGGAGVSFVTLTRVIETIAAADPSIGQLPQNHLGLVDVIALTGTEAQKRFFFGEVLKGRRFGNGFSEKGTKNVLDLRTRVVRDGDAYVIERSRAVKACSSVICSAIRGALPS